MGIRNVITKAGTKAADKVARLSSLSPEQLEIVQNQRKEYLSQVPDPMDPAAQRLTQRLMASAGITIYQEYLAHLKELYVPVKETAEYGTAFDSARNIRFFHITKWVTDKEENSLEKLVNVYEVLSNEECNIGLVFHRTCETTHVYLAVTNTRNADNNVDSDNFRIRIGDAIRGNFPGSEWEHQGNTRSKGDCSGILPCMRQEVPWSVATVSNIPAEKSEKFISQTIEKLLDGIVPDSRNREYIIVLLATPVADIENRKLLLQALYSGLAPYASWTTSFTYDEHSSTGSSATMAVNIGASAGIQNGTSRSVSDTEGTTDSSSTATTDSTSSADTRMTGETVTDSTGSSMTEGTSSGTSSSTSHSEGTNESYTEGTNQSQTAGMEASVTYNESATAGVSGSLGGVVSGNVETGTSIGGSAGIHYSNTGGSSTSVSAGSSASDTLTSGVTESVTRSVAETASKAVSTAASSAVSSTVGQAVANTLGKAVTNSVSKTLGSSNSTSLGVNFGASFARTSTVTATIGKSEGIQQTFVNYNVMHALETLERQMKRLDLGTALGMWDFAAYVMSEDQNVAGNVAHSYLALTQGEESYLSQASVNVWRGDMGEASGDAREICRYLRQLRHPVFGLNPSLAEVDADYLSYPPTVKATTCLSGRELAYALNFPKKSIPGLPVLECAEFGRNVTTYSVRFREASGRPKRVREGNASFSDGIATSAAAADGVMEGPYRRTSRTSDPSCGQGRELELGRIFHMNHEENTAVNLNADSLTSHALITGSTGSGKSNTIYQILNEAMQQGVHFLVVEPAKGEYKHVFGPEEDVFVYGTNPSLTPLLRMNPFSFPKEIHVLEHLDRLVEIFNVCWPMYAAMPAVLKSAVEKSYTDCGWDLTLSVNQYGEELYPSFADVARNIREIIDTSEYDAENKGAYKGSLLTRLESLKTGINGMLFTCDEISAEDLFERNVIVDLSRVGSSETKSLIMGMLVLRLQEFRMAAADEMNAGLRHITVLEEAHHLLRRTSAEQSFEGANLAGKSVEMLAHAIAEMRTYGEGFLIADQAPGLLDLSVIRNTNTKIIMRLPDRSDRELVGRAANLNESQITELSKLPCGVAAVYQNEWVQPVLCKVSYYDRPIRRYQRESGSPEDPPGEKNRKISSAILNGMIHRELYHKDNHGELYRLKRTVLRSGLDTAVKMDFLRCLAAEEEGRRAAFRQLLYDLLCAEKALKASEHCRTIDQWKRTMVREMKLPMDQYTQDQADLILLLILYEQSLRDDTYAELFGRMTELEEDKGKLSENQGPGMM